MTNSMNKPMNNETIQAQLWQTFNAGSMPTGIRMSYQLYFDLMRDDEAFYHCVELATDDANSTSYQGLPVTFDAWYKSTPHIESVPK